MNAEPLNKDIYNKAVKLGVETITLRFSGGSDEGYLDVDIVPWNDQTKTIIGEIENWAWDAYCYSGAGDGNDYGDDVEYDLVNKKVFVSEWYTARQDGDSNSGDLEIESDEE